MKKKYVTKNEEPFTTRNKMGEVGQILVKETDNDSGEWKWIWPEEYETHLIRNKFGKVDVTDGTGKIIGSQG